MAGEAARRQAAAGEKATFGVEEAELELEAHAEAVDRGAARQQESSPGLLATQPGKPEQTGAEARGNRDLDPKRARAR